MLHVLCVSVRPHESIVGVAHFPAASGAFSPHTSQIHHPASDAWSTPHVLILSREKRCVGTVVVVVVVGGTLHDPKDGCLLPPPLLHTQICITEIHVAHYVIGIWSGQIQAAKGEGEAFLL